MEDLYASRPRVLTHADRARTRQLPYEVTKTRFWRGKRIWPPPRLNHLYPNEKAPPPPSPPHTTTSNSATSHEPEAPTAHSGTVERGSVVEEVDVDAREWNKIFDGLVNTRGSLGKKRKGYDEAVDKLYQFEARMTPMDTYFAKKHFRDVMEKRRGEKIAEKREKQTLKARQLVHYKRKLRESKAAAADLMSRYKEYRKQNPNLTHPRDVESTIKLSRPFSVEVGRSSEVATNMHSLMNSATARAHFHRTMSRELLRSRENLVRRHTPSQGSRRGYHASDESASPLPSAAVGPAMTWDWSLADSGARGAGSHTMHARSHNQHLPRLGDGGSGSGGGDEGGSVGALSSVASAASVSLPTVMSGGSLVEVDATSKITSFTLGNTTPRTAYLLHKAATDIGAAWRGYSQRTADTRLNMEFESEFDGGGVGNGSVGRSRTTLPAELLKAVTASTDGLGALRPTSNLGENARQIRMLSSRQRAYSKAEQRLDPVYRDWERRAMASREREESRVQSVKERREKERRIQEGLEIMVQVFDRIGLHRVLGEWDSVEPALRQQELTSIHDLARVCAPPPLPQPNEPHPPSLVGEEGYSAAPEDGVDEVAEDAQQRRLRQEHEAARQVLLCDGVGFDETEVKMLVRGFENNTIQHRLEEVERESGFRSVAASDSRSLLRGSTATSGSRNQRLRRRRGHATEDTEEDPELRVDIGASLIAEGEQILREKAVIKASVEYNAACIIQRLARAVLSSATVAGPVVAASDSVTFADDTAATTATTADTSGYIDKAGARRRREAYRALKRNQSLKRRIDRLEREHKEKMDFANAQMTSFQRKFRDYVIHRDTVAAAKVTIGKMVSYHLMNTKGKEFMDAMRRERKQQLFGTIDTIVVNFKRRIVALFREWHRVAADYARRRRVLARRVKQKQAVVIERMFREALDHKRRLRSSILSNMVPTLTRCFQSYRLSGWDWTVLLMALNEAFEEHDPTQVFGIVLRQTGVNASKIHCQWRASTMRNDREEERLHRLTNVNPGVAIKGMHGEALAVPQLHVALEHLLLLSPMSNPASVPQVEFNSSGGGAEVVGEEGTEQRQTSVGGSAKETDDIPKVVHQHLTRGFWMFLASCQDFFVDCRRAMLAQQAEQTQQEEYDMLRDFVSLCIHKRRTHLPELPTHFKPPRVRTMPTATAADNELNGNSGSSNDVKATIRPFWHWLNESEVCDQCFHMYLGHLGRCDHCGRVDNARFQLPTRAQGHRDRAVDGTAKATVYGAGDLDDEPARMFIIHAALALLSPVGSWRRDQPLHLVWQSAVKMAEPVVAALDRGGIHTVSDLAARQTDLFSIAPHPPELMSKVITFLGTIQNLLIDLEASRKLLNTTHVIRPMTKHYRDKAQDAARAPAYKDFLAGVGGEALLNRDMQVLSAISRSTHSPEVKSRMRYEYLEHQTTYQYGGGSQEAARSVIVQYHGEDGTGGSGGSGIKAGGWDGGEAIATGHHHHHSRQMGMGAQRRRGGGGGSGGGGGAGRRGVRAKGGATRTVDFGRNNARVRPVKRGLYS